MLLSLKCLEVSGWVAISSGESSFEPCCGTSFEPQQVQWKDVGQTTSCTSCDIHMPLAYIGCRELACSLCSTLYVLIYDYTCTPRSKLLFPPTRTFGRKLLSQAALAWPHRLGWRWDRGTDLPWVARRQRGVGIVKGWRLTGQIAIAITTRYNKHVENYDKTHDESWILVMIVMVLWW